MEPLHLALRRLSDSHRAFLSNHSARSRTFLQDLDELCNLYEASDDHSDNGEEKQTKLKQALRQSHALSTSNGACTLETTIADCGLNPESICQNKHIRQVCKLGRYWGFCLDTPNDAGRYPKLFRTVTIEYLLPYEPTKSTISYSQRSSVECYVHAEIQLLLYNDNPLNKSVQYLGPRVFGVSKSACYLCNLFILGHGDFFISKTHGRLYDQWALPDLAEYTPQHRQKYRNILKVMAAEMQSAIPRQPYRKRQYPLGSWISLPTPPPASLTASDAGTGLSGLSGSHLTPSRTPVATTRMLTPHLPSASGSILPSSPTPDKPAQGTPRPHDNPSPSDRHLSPPVPLPKAAPPPVPSSPPPAAPDLQPPPAASSSQSPSPPPQQPSPSPLPPPPPSSNPSRLPADKPRPLSPPKHPHLSPAPPQLTHLPPALPQHPPPNPPPPSHSAAYTPQPLFPPPPLPTPSPPPSPSTTNLLTPTHTPPPPLPPSIHNPRDRASILRPHPDPSPSPQQNLRPPTEPPPSPSTTHPHIRIHHRRRRAHPRRAAHVCKGRGGGEDGACAAAPRWAGCAAGVGMAVRVSCGGMDGRDVQVMERAGWVWCFLDCGDTRWGMTQCGCRGRRGPVGRASHGYDIQLTAFGFHTEMPQDGRGKPEWGLVRIWRLQQRFKKLPFSHICLSFVALPLSLFCLLCNTLASLPAASLHPSTRNALRPNAQAQ